MKLDEPKELSLSHSSPEESAFRSAASNLWSQHRLVLDSDNQSEIDAFWRTFWTLVREAGRSAAAKVIPSLPWRLLLIEENLYSGLMVEFKEGKELLPSLFSWHNLLLLRTIAGSWKPFSHTLLPGPIVPADGSRDGDIAIDMEFHKAVRDLLVDLRAVRKPVEKYELLPKIRYHFLKRCRDKYCRRDDLPRKKPRLEKLNFDTMTTSGPLEVLEALSDEGAADYTWALLNLDDTYEKWTMRHDGTQSDYPSMEFESPALEELREHGRIRTDAGIRRLSDGLGSKPDDPGVLNNLRQHPKARLIRHAFDLEAASDPTVEPISECDPVPLRDIWPGLRPHLWPKEAILELIRCGDLKNETGRIGGTLTADAVYITRRDDDREELRAVLHELGLLLDRETTEKISIQAARDKIRACSTDQERLLAAVGKDRLKDGLPKSLVSVLEQTHETLTGEQIAQAAIATYHTGALREYRHALERLDPPSQWAGGPQTVEFVRSLGFGEAWARERNTSDEDYIEVEGPYSLPKLHCYQRTIVDNVKRLIQSDGLVGKRRGLITMPTGSGKTRVAVQAIVEAIRCNDFKGGILWVADRYELCEQAVESWRQVWSREGNPATQLRISRMWGDHRPPSPTSEMHVIVATVQTVAAKMKAEHESYRFLEDFKLLVVDEAHRSVTPTHTLVMQALGLTRRKGVQEPILLGLTATPYRGSDVAETRRLVNRYDNNRLDAGAFASDDSQDVIRELQEKQILAQAKHATIDGVVGFRLTGDELQQYEKAPWWLPQHVEDRIADDADRTLRIIEAYQKHVLDQNPDWPTLVFATSVEHSQTVAALLTLEGVKARAVSGDTDRSSRRRIVEEFRAGEIKVLVNYAIFREGFDAPRTRAIIVARPVYSPNLYFQMIGRGLRGTKNGGNERCLILNVEDNIENFEGKLAFSELDWLWARAVA